MWFGHTRLEIKEDNLEVATDSAFVKRWIDSHFAKDLHDAAEETMGRSPKIEVHVRPELFDPSDAGPERPEPSESRPRRQDAGSSTRRHGRSGTDEAPPASRSRQRDTFAAPMRRFEDFVVGASNKLAFSAARQLVEDDKASLISPLFVHGDCGVGKTHIVQAICQRYTELTGRTHQVRYVTGEQFTNDYIAAVRDHSLDQFRRRCRKVDLLAIDDVHFLSNKVRTQSEFLHTLDAIDLAGARVVITSDAHPRQIKRFSQALISRFLSGMVVQIERPDRETRMQLIRNLASVRGLRLNQAAVERIATRCVGSVRELEGAVTKLAAVHAVTVNGSTNGEVGLVLVDQLFSERTWQPVAPIRIGQVIDSTCDLLGIGRSDLMGNGRHRRVVLARALVAYLGRELTTHSYPEIAQSLGRRYHSTVHTAAQRLRKQLENAESVVLGGGEAPMALKDLVDQLRHTIMRGTRG